MDQGFAIWFTGIAGSGKSTLASEVARRLRDLGCKVENLDADEVRANLSPDLKWSPADRDMNTKRLTFLAKLLARNGVVALIAAVASERRFRDRARAEVQNFVEVYVKCSLEECQRRDPKGLYSRAARGEVNDIAGMHQPYEEPEHPEVVVETDKETVAESTEKVLVTLGRLGLIAYGGADGSAGVYTDEEEKKVAARLKGLGYL